MAKKIPLPPPKKVEKKKKKKTPCITTKLKWYKPSEKKPRIDKGEYMSSVKVLIKWKWVNAVTGTSMARPRVSTGHHRPKTDGWNIDGSSGKIKVLRWAYITYPGMDAVKDLPKPKRKKAQRVPDDPRKR